MGYGSRAIQALTGFYNGELYDIGTENIEFDRDDLNDSGPSPGSKLQDEKIAVRSVESMPPLLQRLAERKPEQLDYLGVSFGLTRELLRFWRRSGFVPLYASQKANALTGEYSFVVLKMLASSVAQDVSWLSSFAAGESTNLFSPESI